MIDPVCVWALRAAGVVLFGAAAFHKFRGLSRFAATLRGYRILPGALSTPAALGVGALELITALAIATPAAGVVGPALAVGLLGLYSGAIGWNLARGRRDIDCGCLGPAHRQPLSEWLLLRNGLVAIGAIALALPARTRELLWIDGLTIVGGASLLVLFWIAAHQLAANGPALRALGGSR